MPKAQPPSLIAFAPKDISVAKSVDRLFKSVVRLAGPSTEKKADIFYWAHLLQPCQLPDSQRFPK